jgi:hypothetical protein
MPERVEQYRLYADKCHELAAAFKNPDAKRTMFAMRVADIGGTTCQEHRNG